jgi:hypothetical protein
MIKNGNPMKQTYKVIRPFDAKEPVSGAQRQFSPEEIVVCDTKQSGSTLTLEVDGAPTAYFLVERSVFEACCKRISRTAGSI